MVILNTFSFCTLFFLVNEYGSSSFCVGDRGVFISTKNGIYQLTKPKILRSIAVNVEGRNDRYSDLFLFKNFIFAVQESHDLMTSNVEPETSLVKINIDTSEITIIVI